MKGRVFGLLGGEPGSADQGSQASRLSSWAGVGVLGAEQGFQGCRAGFSGGGGDPGCGSGLPQTQPGILQVQSWVLGHNQGAEVLGCSQGDQGWDAGPVREFWERAGWAKP